MKAEYWGPLKWKTVLTEGMSHARVESYCNGSEIRLPVLWDGFLPLRENAWARTLRQFLIQLIGALQKPLNRTNQYGGD